MFLRVMAWKEWREQRMQAGLLTALAVVLLAGVFPLFREDFDVAAMMPMAALVFAWACGMVTGAVALANEQEMHTQAFLDQLPRSRSYIWGCKLFVALVIVAVQSVILTTAAVSVMPLPTAGLNSPSSVALGCLLTGVFGLGCGLLGSALSSTVLAAIGWAVVALLGTAFGVGVVALAIAVVMASLLNVRDRQLDSVSMLVSLAAIPVPVVLSALVYGHVDRRRRSNETLAFPTGLWFTPTGFGLRSTLWLSLRQGWSLTLSLLLLTVPLAPLIIFDPLLIWPLATLGIGLLMGVATLGDEQYYGSLRFLAEQRLPLGRVWFLKVGLRLVLTVGLILVLALLVALSFAVARESELGSFQAWERGSEAVFARQIGASVTLSVWGLYGFAFGHLAAMIARKSFVAFAIAAAAAFMSLAAWLPSMISGGLPTWQVMLVPLAIMVVARLSVWAWATERLGTRRVARWWVLGGIVTGGFIFGCLVYRDLEAPTVPEPFDVRELAAHYPTRDQNLVRSKIVMADERFRLHVRTHKAELTLPAVNDRFREFNPPVNLIDLALLHGWPKKVTDEDRLAELTAQGGWLSALREVAALPAMPADDPRDEALTSFSPVSRLAPLATYASFYALHLQSRGQHEEALNLLADLLEIARRVETHSSLTMYQHGLMIESVALLSLGHWANHAELSVALLQRALKWVQHHERARPPYSEAVAGDYLRARELLDTTPDTLFSLADTEPRWLQLLPLAALNAPWETTRRRQLLDAYYDLYQNAAPWDYPTLQSRNQLLQQGALTSSRSLDNWMPPVRDDSEESRREHLAALIRSDLFLLRILPRHQPSYEIERFRCIAQSRALRILIAARLYQVQHAAELRELKQLVPEFLEAIPIDPFTGKPFHYRLIDQPEWIEWQEVARPGDDDWASSSTIPLPLKNRSEPGVRPMFDGENPATHRRLRTGFALVWSAGPDGANDGGQRQHPWGLPGRSYWHRPRIGEDWIWVIKPFKK